MNFKKVIVVLIGLICLLISFELGYKTSDLIFSNDFYQIPMFILANALVITTGYLWMWNAKNKLNKLQNVIGFDFAGMSIMGLFAYVFNHNSFASETLRAGSLFVPLGILLFIYFLFDNKIKKSLKEQEGSEG